MNYLFEWRKGRKGKGMEEERDGRGSIKVCLEWRRRVRSALEGRGKGVVGGLKARITVFRSSFQGRAP